MTLIFFSYQTPFPCRDAPDFVFCQYPDCTVYDSRLLRDAIISVGQLNYICGDCCSRLIFLNPRKVMTNEFFLSLMATCFFHNGVKTDNSDPGGQAVMNEYKAFPTTRISVKKMFRTKIILAYSVVLYRL